MLLESGRCRVSSFTVDLCSSQLYFELMTEVAGKTLHSNRLSSLDAGSYTQPCITHTFFLCNACYNKKVVRHVDFRGCYTVICQLLIILILKYLYVVFFS